MTSLPADEELAFVVTPAAVGEQFVRASLPAPRGFLRENLTSATVRAGGELLSAGVRVLSWYPTLPDESRSARRVLVSLLNDFFRWERFLSDDPQWPRVVEFRINALGEVVCVAHLQRRADADGFAPELGWEVTGAAIQVALRAGLETLRPENGAVTHSFVDGKEAVCLWDQSLAIYHPVAPLKRRGGLQVTAEENSRWRYRYLRCRAEDRVPMQPMAWQRAEIVIAPPGLAPLTSTLQSRHRVECPPTAWTPLYGDLRSLPQLLQPLEDLVRYHRDAVVQSSVVGDDVGNVTGFQHGSAHGSSFGMNRLNHCAAIFEDGWRSADRRLTETALLWCDNFYDQTIWWGEPQRGGTRYNNLVAMSQTPLTTDYMWRSNSSMETVLRARFQRFQRTGTILSAVDGWETSTGQQGLLQRYASPADRDAGRDYDQGRLSYGSAPPEGLVYLPEVLGYCLQHRSTDNLLALPQPDEPLARILARSPEKIPHSR